MALLDRAIQPARVYAPIDRLTTWMARSPPSRGQALRAMTALVIPESAKTR